MSEKQFTDQNKICEYCSEIIKVDVKLKSTDYVTVVSFTCSECGEINIEIHKL